MKEILCLCNKVLLEYQDDLPNPEIKKKINKLVEKGKISKWRRWIKNPLNPNILLHEDIFLCNECLDKTSKKIKTGNSHKEIFNKLKKKIDKKNKYLK